MAKGKSTLHSSHPDEDGGELDRNNLIAALQMIANELKRYNDANDTQPVVRGEAEFGKATYTDRQQREQSEQLHAALDAKAPPRAKGRQRKG